MRVTILKGQRGNQLRCPFACSGASENQLSCGRQLIGSVSPEIPTPVMKIDRLASRNNLSAVGSYTQRRWFVALHRRLIALAKASQQNKVEASETSGGKPPFPTARLRALNPRFATSEVGKGGLPPPESRYLFLNLLFNFVLVVNAIYI